MNCVKSSFRNRLIIENTSACVTSRRVTYKCVINISS